MGISDSRPRWTIHGGPPAFPQGPPEWPLADDDVRAALEAAYQNGSWGRYHGPYLDPFSQQLAEQHGSGYALPCCSGTFAVELALRALKLQEGDEVILAGYDFPGNFRAVEAVGARPVLVDIEPRSWCLNVDQLAAAASAATRAVLVSHLHGGLADMASLRAIADGHGWQIVEDACQSPGATVQGRVAGTWGDVGVLSFGGSKLLSAGRGGALLTSREKLFQRAKIFCERGNHAFPLTELQAALLLPQLAKLADRNAQRQRSVARLLAATEPVSLLTPVAVDGHRGEPSFYKLAWLLQGQATNPAWRDEVLQALQAEGVAVDVGFRGFTRRGARRCRRASDLRHSQAAADRTVLLHHPILLQAEPEIDKLAAAITKVAQHLY